MISPDLSRLVDLRSFEVDPFVIRQKALAAVKDALSDEGYDPLVGDPDVALLGGSAWIAAQVGEAANRAAWGAVQGVLASLGVPWWAGSKATSTVTVTGTPGTVLSAGLMVTTADSGLATQVAFTTDEQAVIGDDGYVEVPITALLDGSLPNRLPAGTDMAVTPATYLVSGVEMLQRPTGGTDPETSDEYYARIASRMSRLCDSLVTANHYTQAALESPYVHRAKAIDSWDGVSGARTQWGHVAVVVCGLDGALLTTEQKESVHTYLVDHGVHHLTVHIIDPVFVEVDVTCTVRRRNGYTDGETTAGVQSAMSTYISPNTWAWGDTVERADLIEIIGRDVISVDIISTLAAPAADVTLDDHTLPTCGTVTVTVTPP